MPSRTRRESAVRTPQIPATIRGFPSHLPFPATRATGKTPGNHRRSSRNRWRDRSRGTAFACSATPAESVAADHHTGSAVVSSRFGTSRLREDIPRERGCCFFLSSSLVIFPSERARRCVRACVRAGSPGSLVSFHTGQLAFSSYGHGPPESRSPIYATMEFRANPSFLTRLGKKQPGGINAG